MTQRFTFRLGLHLAVGVVSLSALAAELPAGFTEEILATNLNAATAMAVAPDGRVFVADQTGPLRVWKNGRVLPVPALDLSDRLDTYWERGLVGVTLHPDFPQTSHLFVVYVAKAPFTHHVVSQFTLIGDRANPASERVLLEGDDQKLFRGSQPAGHQGAPIRFGPDGKLYVALGEQTAGKPSQSLSALQGKILRLNPDGSIPADNPFHSQSTGKYRAIWAYGLRNPFGLAFQPETGRLFESDVGQSSWEEVNEIVRGGNYGWPEAEGKSTNAAFQNPLYAYPPAIGRSIVGGVFYPRGGASNAQGHPFPERWRGKYFFADWAANWVKALDPESPTNVATFARGFDAPVAVEVAPDGSLLVLNRGTIWRDNKKWRPNTGSLVRIRYGGLDGSLSRTAESGPPLPRTLAATGAFKSFQPLVPREDFVAFEINLPPWQPGVAGQRWISLPPGGRLGINAEGEFKFPKGAIVVQHYVVEQTRAPFETHMLWFTGPRTARAAAYRWRAAAPEATLVEDGEVARLPGDGRRQWFSPGAEESLNLDTVVVGFLLPVSPRQLNRSDQLERWSKRGWLAPEALRQDAPRLAALDDISASLELRVRSYLDVNCSACHRPGGPSRGNFDARFTVPLGQQRLLDGELAAGDLGIAGARVIVAHHPDQSVMLQRVSRNDSFRMSPVSVNDEPQPLVPLLEKWIRELK